jgi:hypothetical protein
LISLTEIEKHLIKSDDQTLPDNFVAIASQLNDAGLAFHSALIIAYDAKYYLFHYTGNAIEFVNYPKPIWFVHKNLNCISDKFVPSFFNHCKIISEEAKPKYGYFYPGSYYDENKKYYTDSGIAEYMTCVGFCINVVTGFIESKSYIVYTDWKEDTVHDSENFLNDFIKRYNIPKEKVDTYKKHLRRISPPELLSSAYISTLPITKKAIDNILGDVTKALVSKRITPPPTS